MGPFHGTRLLKISVTGTGVLKIEAHILIPSFRSFFRPWWPIFKALQLRRLFVEWSDTCRIVQVLHKDSSDTLMRLPFSLCGSILNDLLVHLFSPPLRPPFPKAVAKSAIHPCSDLEHVSLINKTMVISPVHDCCDLELLLSSYVAFVEEVGFPSTHRGASRIVGLLQPIREMKSCCSIEGSLLNLSRRKGVLRVVGHSFWCKKPSDLALTSLF